MPNKTRLQILRRLEQVLSQAREDLGEACQLAAEYSGEGLEKITARCEALNAELKSLWEVVVVDLERERDQRKRKRP
jgi:hypothetical protein